ncbi:MAG: hypothetical protein HFJ41_03755 [Clostridia bacterium]|nr:hypothetical protein [Clostridia bacterium]
MWNKEKQSLLQARTKRLRIAENKVEELTQENKALYEENRDLRFENEEQRYIINEIINLATSNTYNNEKVILNKIKELAYDSQSEN